VSPMKFTIGADASGSQFQMSVDDLLEVVLRENPTTGYRWDITQIPNNVELRHSRFSGSPEGAIGASGLRTVSLRAIHPGQGRLELMLVRKWEPTAPIEEFQIELVVLRD